MIRVSLYKASLTRSLCSRVSKCRRKYHEVSFQKHGAPAEVLTCISRNQHFFPQFEPRDAVLVEMISAPWNPADVNTVEGKYASPYKLFAPALEESLSPDHIRQSPIDASRTVAGSEGWGRVLEVRDYDSSIHIGDWITLGWPGLGTLRTSLWLPELAVIPLPRGEELFQRHDIAACTLFQLGGTALRMLRDFQKLEPGDVVVQNAGNSAVGFVLSQLVYHMFPGVSMVSIVRRGTRSDQVYNDMKNHLLVKGRNSLVVAEEDLENKDNLKHVNSEIMQLSGRAPKLALNAVGGESASKLLNLLGQGGSLVTYGGMSMNPVIVSTPHLIFKNVSVHGYWQSRWMVQNSIERRTQLMNELVDVALDSSVILPLTSAHTLDDIHNALHSERKQAEAPVRSKLIFDCRE